VIELWKYWVAAVISFIAGVVCGRISKPGVSVDREEM
jgi:hypothetical protein